MPHRRTETSALASLAARCRRVASLACAFEDVEAQVEEEAYAACREGQIDGVVAELSSLAGAFENMENKSEERLHDLGSVYVLLGEVLQTFDRVGESIPWFQKAVVVDDRDARPYQGLARSYLATGDLDKSVRSLEQEVALAPGNYYSFLMLAELYGKRGEPGKVEACLERLLQRDPDNLAALHGLIAHHRATHPQLDVEFLRRRLLAITRPLSKRELLIWAFHMCEEGRVDEVVSRAAEQHPAAEQPYWELVAWHCANVRKLREERTAAITRLAALVSGNSKSWKTWIDEYASVFGARHAGALQRDFASPQRA